jgi:prophage antirepressor-like protein
MTTQKREKVDKNKIALFQGKRVRRVLLNDEWFFSVIDVVDILTESASSRRYWSDLKRKLKKEGYEQLYENIVQLKLEASDGKKYLTDCANTETMFRIIQSIPSKKAEPFKQWLARVGKERIDEIENPELAMHRTKEIYEKKGYPKDWIEKRMRGISVRHKLKDEWKGRGAELQTEYAILTNEIMQGTFELKVDEYKKHKGLKRENLRDHMTDLELILTMLGEATTTQIHKDRNSQGFTQLHNDAKDGGAVAGRTRKDIEGKTGRKIVSKENYLPTKKKKIQ